MPPKIEIVTALSLRVAGVLLVTVLDVKAKTARIELRGEPLNGDAAAIDEARRLLVGRVMRVHPDYRIMEG